MKMDTSKLAAVTIAGVCVFFSIMFIVFLFIQPELDPIRRFGSEYVVGRSGWLMRVAFYSFATGLLAFVIAAGKTFDREIRSPLVLALFAIGAVGILFSGIFDGELQIPNPMPPPEWTFPQEVPWTHHVHGWAGVTAFLAMVPAVALMTRRLRKAGRLNGKYKTLRILAWVLPLAFVFFAGWSISAGYAGIGQRLFLATFFAWMLIASFGIYTGAFSQDRANSKPQA